MKRDVIVIGAGPAGSLAARELARAGADVLLLEKREFPRDKVCGCCLGGASLAHLAAVGIAAPAGPALRHLDLRVGARRAVLPLPSGRVVSRAALDAALLEEARRAGVEVRTGAPATLGPVSKGGPSSGDARVVHVDGDELHAGLVLLATGLGGAAELGARPAPRSRVGLGAHLTADEAEAFHTPGTSPDTVTMACGAEGYVGLVHDEAGRLNLAAAVDPGALRDRGAQEVITQLLGRAGLPGLPTAEWHGTPPLTRSGPAVAERVLALGDAAGYVEPFTGEGIGWALATARAVVPLALGGWSPELSRRWPLEVRRVVDKRTCRATATMLRHPRLLGAVLPLLSAMPGLAAPLIRAVQRP